MTLKNIFYSKKNKQIVTGIFDVGKVGCQPSFPILWFCNLKSVYI
jgi:hypothetical protein